MPKGHKSQHGYATISSIDGGMDYRTIAEKMTESGYKMNHATARNVFLKAMKKIAAPVHDLFGRPASDEDLIRTAKDPRFQESVVEIIEDHSDIKL
jgi:hypothetical protein